MTINHNEVVTLIEAHRAGKKIEEKWPDEDWSPFSGNFYFGDNYLVQYRIVEEPKKVKLLAYLTDDGRLRFVEEGSEAHGILTRTTYRRLPNLDKIEVLQ